MAYKRKTIDRWDIMTNFCEIGKAQRAYKRIERRLYNMRTPKNTFMRDENGNIREGIKWYLELNEILVKFFGNECGCSRGFQYVSFNDGTGGLANVFELDIDKQPTPDFLEYIKGYKSEKIKGILYRKEIEMYGRTMYRNAVITLL